MSKTAAREYPVDYSSILFLTLLRPHHTNAFRFCARLRSPIRPEVLQEAVNRIHPRFPTVIAGFRQDFFHYRQVAAEVPPTVQPDPGMLIPMSPAELRRCAFRVYYQNTTISIEAFHALTDGSGAIFTLTTLVQEYLRILHETEPCLSGAVSPLPEAPQPHETEDSYAVLADAAPRSAPTRFAYQLPRPADSDWTVRGSSLSVDAAALVDAAHRHDVTVNSLLIALLADSAMDLQIRERGTEKLKPVRIMVPVNLRKLIGSRTLRNFTHFVLPTMEAHHHSLSTMELCKIIGDQQKQQLSKENLSGLVSRNVRLQRAWWFKIMPWVVKRAMMRLVYRFFGESNSSITMSNLGIVRMPEELQPHVEDFQCWMIPRAGSPYVCTILSFGDKLTVNVSRFCPTDELGQVFFEKINSVVAK